ncbi:MAG: transcription termination/antitermination factor NusG [Clostridia bacterium]|nr:transcription termination/antitermination factor NusG [Clostridia bacterium]MBR7100542.1 transcription termination/antitermination factor NusG [Clostridia bacterium]
MENVATEKLEWYILHTYSEYEAMVKDSLEKLIENNNLKDQVTDIKIPMEEVMEEKNGKKKIVSRKLLPSYVFIKMIYSNQLWYMITQTRGVTGFVGPQGRPIPMKADEIRKMRLEEFVSDADFKVGDTVSIDAGPLEGFTGIITKINDAVQKARVNIEMFGRSTDVEVEYLQMKKVDVVLPAEEEQALAEAASEEETN